ncbi:Dolichyl-phosphate-mannose-protein mannosyltransferase [Bhargavaea ginsengi]|uniref:Dolichyl-phosphate-mannose-protein mannosyltransferase n=1 Tax=Bhargavaea ginsengi TaxID=426757 RepID=A0A1H6UN41_9BACL|nr:hypothetical protein [Bhargavaea ginsengi]SEI92104.1 Dolichyl-phosphate-mannose-protein mannosyltransferase [Bhargavaea ginsengi]
MPKQKLLISSFIILIIAFLLSLIFILRDLIPREIIAFGSLFLFFIGIVTLFTRYIDKPVPMSIGIILIFGFVFRSIYSFNLYNTITSPFPDSFKYLENLETLLIMGNPSFTSVESIVGTSQFFYYFIMYYTYSIFNTNYALYIVNILFFSVSMLFLYQVILKDFGKKIAYWTTVASIFSMTFFTFTSTILKDSTVLLLAMSIAFIYKTCSKKYYIFLILLLPLLFTTRIYAGASMLLAILVDILLNKTKGLNILFRMIPIIGIILVLLLAFNYTFLQSYLDLGADFLTSNSILEGIIGIPLAFINLTFTPVPWGVFTNQHSAYSLIQIDTFFTLLFSFSLILFVVKVLKNEELRRKIHFYILPILVHAYVLGTAYGGGVRQKIAVYSFIILLYVIGLLYKKSSNKSLHPIKQTDQ